MPHARQAIAAALFAAALIPAASFGAQVRLAVTYLSAQGSNEAVIAPSIEALRKEFGSENIELLKLTLPEFEKAADEKRFDLFLSTAGLSRRMAGYGAKDLVSLVSDRFPDPNKTYGTLFIVRKDSPVRTVADMKGKSAAGNFEGGFTGWQIGMGELIRQGYSPAGFFSKTEFLGWDMRHVVNAVMEGKAEVGALSSCYLEDNYPPGSPQREGLRGVGVVESSPCMRSTDAYPSWAVSTMPSTDTEVARRATLALLSMPPQAGGLRWGIGTDFTSTDRLFRELQVGSYGFLRNWLFSRYGKWILAALAVILSIAALALTLSGLVRLKTRDLRLALEREIELKKSEQEAHEKVSSMQKALLVGQMSSMIAHELRQPLAAIEAFAHGGQRFLENGELDNERCRTMLERIRRQAKRAEEIIDRVRDYAKGRKSGHELTDLGEIAGRAAQLFSNTGRFPGKLVFPPPGEKLPVMGNPLELELAVRNLLKNAAEALAAGGIAAPAIEIRTGRSSDGKEAFICVTDNGHAVPPERIAQMAVPLHSSKMEGLGLGLSIVSSIASAHGGRLELSPNSPGGLRATVWIPAKENAP